MKKRTVYILGMAAALTAGMTMTALAGWVKEGNDWYYYHDRSGHKLTDEWVKTNDLYYYLDYNGKMVTDSMIDDTYYVDTTGVRLTNAWKMIYDWDDEDETGWRYFGSNGKIYSEGSRQINGYHYYFEDGIMQTGWVEDDDDICYYKDSGERVSGWRWLTDPDEDEWGENWYYFSGTGKMYKDAVKTIDGEEYIFDEEGRMLTGWVNPDDYTSTGREDLSSEDPSELLYFEESGAAAEKWYFMSSPDGSDDYWHYFKDGQAYAPGYKTTTVCEYGMAKIDNEYYCFDEEGHMVTGLIQVEDGRYFLFDENNGRMVTGHATVDNDEFEDQDFYFYTSGAIGKRGSGLTGVKDSHVYDNGIMLCAEDGMKYEIVEIVDDGVKKQFLVSESGKIKTSGTVKDGNGTRYKVTKVDGLYKIEEVYD